MNVEQNSWPEISDIAPAKRQRISLISATNMAIRFTEKCMGQKLYSRIEKSLAYLKHLPSRNPVVERILNPTGQKLHL